MFYESKERLTPLNYAYQLSNHFYWILTPKIFKHQNLQIMLTNKFFNLWTRMDFWDKYYFIDSLLQPASSSKVFSTNLLLDKQLTYRHLRLAPFVRGTISNKQDLWLLPKVVPGLNLGLQHMLKKQKLTLSYSISYMYIPTHLAFGFQPGLNMFYTKSNSTLPDVHYLDFIASGAIKSFTFFIESDNILNGLVGQYYALADIPMQRRTIRMGVNWTFKN
ncbi:MAG: hypothetical protein IPO27_11575 [Bacteroidetes bacterium]|nr:hypothetical protein [Bacteroidota bacterium]